jgi:hypothetical protein
MFWIINGPDAALGYPEFSGAGHRRTDSRDGKIRLSGTVTVRQAIMNGPRARGGVKKVGRFLTVPAYLAD